MEHKNFALGELGFARLVRRIPFDHVPELAR